jgi:hypothetical protein
VEPPAPPRAVIGCVHVALDSTAMEIVPPAPPVVSMLA